MSTAKQSPKKGAQDTGAQITGAEKNSSRTRAIVVAGVLLALIVGALIFAVVSTSKDDAAVDSSVVVAEVQDVTIVGDPLPKAPEGNAADTAIGKKAPTLAGLNFVGDSVAVGSAGRPELVVFVAHWCPHCQREIPVLVDWLASDKAPEGVDVVAVATGTTDAAPNYPPSAWLETEKWPNQVLVDDVNSSAAGSYGLSGFPFIVLLNSDGTVAARFSGETPVSDLEAAIAKAK